MFNLVESLQQGVVFIPFRLLDTAGTPSLEEGGSFLTLADGGAGIYQFTFGGTRSLAASARVPVVLANVVVATTVELIANVVSPAVTGFTIEVNDDAGTATDASVHGLVVWFKRADQY